jgi:anti-sigma regulatory factor (Ser/Thr protein kinase)
VKDLSLHLADILENAAKAGATRVVVSLWWTASVFCFEVEDNGPGLPAAVADAPTDPYRTTRRERSVGLGLALLRASAEQTGGRVEVHSQPGHGVRVRADFPMAHVDAKPLGDLAGTLLTAALGWPLDLVVRVGSPAETVLDTAEVRRELGEVPLTHPDVARFLGATLTAATGPLQQPVEGIFGRLGEAATVAPAAAAGGSPGTPQSSRVHSVRKA